MFHSILLKSSGYPDNSHNILTLTHSITSRKIYSKTSGRYAYIGYTIKPSRQNGQIVVVNNASIENIDPSYDTDDDTIDEFMNKIVDGIQGCINNFQDYYNECIGDISITINRILYTRDSTPFCFMRAAWQMLDEIFTTARYHKHHEHWNRISSTHLGSYLQVGATPDKLYLLPEISQKIILLDRFEYCMCQKHGQFIDFFKHWHQLELDRLTEILLEIQADKAYLVVIKCYQIIKQHQFPTGFISPYEIDKMLTKNDCEQLTELTENYRQLSPETMKIACAYFSNHIIG